MIAKFNGIIYLIIYIVHFGIIAFYACQLLFGTKKFMDKFGTDFWWNKYEDTYNKMCKELDLTPSKAIHVAYDDKRMCGVRPILRKIYGR